MASWSEVDLSNVATDNNVLPEGQYYTFELLPGARPNKYDEGKIDAAAKVISGEFEGRVKYFSYPNPEKVGNWVFGVFTRMSHALGVEIEENEKPEVYLNRVAGGVFMAPVKHRTYEQEGETITKDEIRIGNVKAFRPV